MRKLVKISVFGRWVFRSTDWVKITCKEKQKNVSIYQTAGLWHKTLKWTLKITEWYHCGHGDWHSACLLLTRWASCSHCRLLFQTQQKEADKDETHASPRRTFMILEIFFWSQYLQLWDNSCLFGILEFFVSSSENGVIVITWPSRARIR